MSLSAAPAASATGNITITNTGKGPLNGNVTLPNHHPPFSEMGGGAFSIGPGRHEDVTIVYSPATKGSTSDQIVITSDDPTHKKATKIKLKGKPKCRRTLILPPVRTPQLTPARQSGVRALRSPSCWMSITRHGGILAPDFQSHVADPFGFRFDYGDLYLRGVVIPYPGLSKKTFRF